MHKQSGTGLYTAKDIFSALQNLSMSEKQKFIGLFMEVEKQSYPKVNPNNTKNGKTKQAAETQIFIKNDTGF